MTHAPISDAKQLQRIFKVVGWIGLIASCAMVAKYGSSMSPMHAVGLVLVTIVAAFIFPMRQFIQASGHLWAARIIMLVGVFFLGVEFFSDLGYTIGTREHSVVDVSKINADFKRDEDALAADQATINTLRGRQKVLLDKLSSQGGWDTTVSDVSGISAQIDAANKAIELEEQRGGCKSKCLALMKQKGDLEGRIAAASEVKSLQAQIDATKAAIDKRTAAINSRPAGFSAVKAQSDFVSQIWLIANGTEGEKALNPDAVTQSLTQIVIGFIIALSVTLLPTTCFYLAFWTPSEFKTQIAEAKAAVQAELAPKAPATPEADELKSIDEIAGRALVVNNTHVAKQDPKAAARMIMAAFEGNRIGRAA